MKFIDTILNAIIGNIENSEGSITINKGIFFTKSVNFESDSQKKQTAAYQVQAKLYAHGVFGQTSKNITNEILGFAFDNTVKYTNEQALAYVQPQLRIFSMLPQKKITASKYAKK